MTIVPKKKVEPRPANKQGQVVVGPDNAVKSKQDEDSHQPDGGQQPLQQPQQQQQHAEPHETLGQPAANQMQAGSDAVREDNTDYTGFSNNNSSGDEHTHDRRQYHQHHHHQPTHHHHNQHHPHQHSHSKYANSKMSDNESNVNHVILITVINPHYPITVELIHQICGTYGKVNRIVIFKKNGVQAMVEFDNVEAAKKARSILHGCDIYSGCCTLKVEYAKTPKLNVHKNDSVSFDYTNPNLGSRPNHATPSESGPSETGNQPQEHHQHHMHTSNNPSQHGGVHGYGHGSSASHHHHRDPSMSKRGAAGNIVSGGDVINVAGHSNSGPHSHHHHANQFHPTQSQHMQPGDHQHQPKQHLAIDGSGGGQHHGGLQSSSYMISGQPLDQSGQPSDADTTAAGTFHHQDSAFNHSPRANIGNQASAANVNGPHQANLVAGGVDTFMPTSAVGSGHHPHMNPHGMHGGSLYPPRHEPGHHHHQHQAHHSQQSHYQSHHLNARSGGGGVGGGSHRGRNPSFAPPISATNPLMAGGGSHLAPQGTVLMVYGLMIDRVNCDRLFNLFCLYGNVVRVKFLRSKAGCAMVQMGDAIAVERCVSSLNKITLFGNEMQISYSKQAFLHDVIQPFTLPDGTPSFKDFLVNKNNRFRDPEVASKNKILPPSSILHFFNAPYGISDDELMMVFKEHAGHEPIATKIFTHKENVKSFSGLVTFRDPIEATEALILCNHLSLPKAGAQHPYILRLCFSPPAY